MTTLLDKAAIEPLLTLVDETTSTNVRLAALEAAASFPLDETAWRAVAQETMRVVNTESPRSAARRRALALAVRIPLRSLREHLQREAKNLEEADRDCILKALRQLHLQVEQAHPIKRGTPPSAFPVTRGGFSPPVVISIDVPEHLQTPKTASSHASLAQDIARHPPRQMIREMSSLVQTARLRTEQTRILGLLAHAGGWQSPDAALRSLTLINDQQPKMARARPPVERAPESPPERVTRSVAPTRSAPARNALRSAPAIKPAAPSTPSAPGTPAEQRRVNARILQGDVVRRTFVAGAENTIRCWIGLPEAHTATASDTIPEVHIPPKGLDLVAQLCWRDGDGVDHQDSQPLLLPPKRTARSGDCDLSLTIPEGERYISADIVFRYRGRIFEAVRLEAFALAPDEAEEPQHEIRLRVQASRRQVIDLQDSQPVQTVVLADAPATTPSTPSAAGAEPSSLRVFGPEGGQHFNLDQAHAAIKWLNDTLSATQTVMVRKQVAQAGPEEFDDSDADALTLMRQMARHGTLLYKQLRDQGFGDPGERIQIVNLQIDHHVPLEFVYDRGYPSAKASFCKEGFEALKAGASACPVCRFPGAEGPKGSVSVICPWGFWALRKVIERVSDTASAQASEPNKARHLLSPMTSVAFASNYRVPEAERTATAAALKAHFGKVLLPKDWVQWRKAVTQHPALLVVLPHHGIQAQLDYLEIGEQTLDEDLAKLSAAQIDPAVVNPDGRDPGPVVLLLGCQTAIDTSTGYVDIARRIQQQHAAIVLGTLAEILGRHAAPIARELALMLANVTGPEADFGTVMRQVRQRMLARGCLIAMCLIALGDAEWRLRPQAA